MKGQINQIEQTYYNKLYIKVMEYKFDMLHHQIIPTIKTLIAIHVHQRSLLNYIIDEDEYINKLH